jgi:hypothetical protein
MPIPTSPTTTPTELPVRPTGLQVKTHVKAGLIMCNHNETLVRPTGLTVKTHVKAGTPSIPIPPP